MTPSERPVDVSIICSVHNEEKNLTPLVERTVAVMERYPHIAGWEMILVDDSSTDASWDVMQELSARFPNYVRLKRHETRRGQKGCFMTGFSAARGWLSVLMDADLQVLPEELPLVLDKAILEGCEMVCTHNDPARGGKSRGIVSRIGNVFMRLIFNSPVRDAGANFMAVHTRYLVGVKLIANDQRYLLPIAVRRGLKKICEVGCVFGLRVYGRSKYSKLRKALTGLPEMLALKWRLLRGFYDAPPVPDGGPTVELRPLAPDEVPQALTTMGLAAGLPDGIKVWALSSNGRPVALAGWHKLDWDSQVLGVESGKIALVSANNEYNKARGALKRLIGACVSDAEGEGVRFLSTRLPANDIAALHAAEDVGFRVIEAYLTYARKPDNLSEPDPRVRRARPDDEAAAMDIAARAFRYNRFMADPLIGGDEAISSRREWVQNGFRGRADAVYVAEENGNVVGFLLLRDKADDGRKIGTIDLIAVSPEHSGKGLGTALVRQALTHYHGKADVVEVGTQAKNIPAVALYESNGFRLVRVEFSLHRHSEKR